MLRRARVCYPIRPSIGNVSKSQKLGVVRLPVRKAMPVSTNSAPIACSTRRRCFLNRAMKAAKGSMAKAAAMNGMPKPSE